MADYRSENDERVPDRGAKPGAGVHPDRPATAETAHDQEHASIKTYVLIGLVLTIITAAEVAVVYIPALAGVLAPLLIGMSLGKFILVVMFYMHLKFDSRLFTGVFVAPLILAIAVVVSLILLFRVLPAYLP